MAMIIVGYMTASSSSNIKWYTTPSLTGWLNWLECVRQAGTGIAGRTQDVGSSRQ